MEIELLTSKSSFADMERNAMNAGLSCRLTSSEGKVPSEFLKQLINLGHESVLEHIYMTFRVKNISRALLQQLARHRHITLSVESTRSTLSKRLLSGELESYFEQLEADGLVYEGALSHLKECLEVMLKIIAEHPEIKNDQLKYFMAEFFPTSLFMTVNVRELRHIFKLRSKAPALREFQILCSRLYQSIYSEYRYLFEDVRA